MGSHKISETFLRLFKIPHKFLTFVGLDTFQ